MNNTTFFNMIKRLKDLYDSFIYRSAKECNLTKKEADVLLFLYNNKNCDTAKDIINKRGFSKAYVSKAITLLEKKRYIVIENDKLDKRYQRIRLNYDSINEIIPVLKRTQEDFLSIITKGITNEELEIHKKIIDKIFDNIVENGKGEQND